ncbi:retrotransposon protein, putative, ty1-copia subclass, partial [Tanacetum coccineum]
QGRNIIDIDKDAEDVVEKEVSTADPVTIAGEVVTTASVEVSAASTTPISVAATTITTTTTTVADESTTTTAPSTIPKAKSITFRDPCESTTRTTSTPTPSNIKDKGKAKMIEPEKPLKKKEQIRLDEELALKLQAKEEEQVRLVREKAEKVKKDNISWDNVHAMIKADRTLKEEKETLCSIKSSRKEEKPPTKAQKKSTMSTYLKHMASYKQSQLKNKSFAEIQKLFDKAMTRVNMFVYMDTELVKESSKKAEAEMAQESSSKSAGDELEQEKAKKQKMDDDKETAELQKLIEVVSDEEGVAIDAIPLATKPPSIVDYKIIKEGKISIYQIIRADGSSMRYSAVIHMLRSFDREDLETLWKIVKARHGYTRPEEGYERVLWGDLKTMCEHHVEDLVWRVNAAGTKLQLLKDYNCSRIKTAEKIKIDWRSRILTINSLPLAPLVYTLVRPSMTTLSANNSIFRSFFEKQKLTRPNFIDWYRQLRIVLSIEDKLKYLEQLIPPALVPPEEIQRNLENLHAQEMLHELKTLFAQQAKQGLLQTVREFHSCKQEEGPFMQYYNMHNMGKTINELHAMLKFHEQTLPKNNAPALHAIRSGKIQKGNNKHKKPQPQLAAREQNQGNGKNKLVYAPKPKISPPPKREDPAKDSISELLKHKKLSQGASGSGIFIIELYNFPNKSWVYDTGCGTHICNTTQGLRGSMKLKPGALSLYVGNDQHAEVEAIRSYHLSLPSGLVIVLKNCHYAPSITRGIISVSCLYDDGYVSRFMDNSIQVSRNNMVYLVLSYRMVSLKLICLILIQMLVLDMVRSMMSQTTLPKSFWDYTLETAARTLNMVPIKKVEKTPYEVWHGQAPKLSYLKVWGCEALVKRDTLTKTDKLEPMSIKCIFIGHPKETMEVSGSLEDLEIIQEEDTHPSIDTSLNHEEDDLEIDEPQSDIIPIRRSTRTRHAPDRMCLYIDAEEHELGDLGEPANYKAALLDPESDKWLNAMNVEMQSMKDNEVWDLVDLPPNGKTVGSKWLFKKKTDMDGAVHTYKAHLVAKGYTQTPRIDYEETFSPVADIRAIRILIAIAAFYDYEIWQMDVKTAFLNGYLSEEVYMEQPEGFVNPKYPNRVCKLKRSIYGLKQASRQWNKRFDDEIKKFGFTQNRDEPCVYLKASGSNVTFLILYVDDILIMGNNIPMLQDVKSYLGRCFAMKDLGEAAYILGIKIYRDRSRRLIEKLRLSKSQGASTLAELKCMQNVPYVLAVGYIMYVVRCTRLDVVFAQNITSRFQQNPSDLHWTTVKNILKYLRNTKDMFLIYGEAKYIAAYDASKEAVWLTNQESLNFHAKVHYLREVIEFGDIKLEKVHTYDNLADPFTKALAFPKHSEHTKNIGMLPASSLM